MFQIRSPKSFLSPNVHDMRITKKLETSHWKPQAFYNSPISDIMHFSSEGIREYLLLLFYQRPSQE